MTRQTHWNALAAMLLVASTGSANGQEVDDLPRSPDQFSYYQLGHHVPPRSGHRGYNGQYLNPRTVIDQNLGLPIEIDIANGEHMYCNTQVWGFKSNGKPAGKSNHILNYTYPWTSTFCELRWSSLQPTRACGPDRPLSHQGIDCRPPRPLADTYWMTAVEDGVVRKARRGLVEFVGTRSGIRWKYRHGATPRVAAGDKVAKGERLTLIPDIGSTPIHLHLEAERPAGNDIDPMAAVIVATMKAMGKTPSITDGELDFDPRYEIPAGALAQACSERATAPALNHSAMSSASEHWCHNGSIMGLARSEGQVRFVYHRPRSAGLSAVVASDPVLVEGSVADGSFSGTAKHYSSRCGNQSFPVSGRWLADAKTVVLTGTRKRFGSNCGATDTRETLTFVQIRSVNPNAPPPDPERRSLTEITRNWGAITMPFADVNRWLPYVREWPGLVLGAELTDSAGGVIPALQTDEAGVGLWWYWLAVRKGFGEAGSPNFLEIARGIAGYSAPQSSVQRYINQYVALAPRYFGRSVSTSERFDLADPEERYALGQTMFHHESGRTPLIDRATFKRGVAFGSDIINNRFKTVAHYTASGAQEEASSDEVAADIGAAATARITALEHENRTLRTDLEQLRQTLASIREILGRPYANQ